MVNGVAEHLVKCAHVWIASRISVLTSAIAGRSTRKKPNYKSRDSAFNFARGSKRYGES
jgi:hypothetical protein